MSQSCYFAKVCDGELKKKHIGVSLFSLQLCEKMLKIVCEKGTKHVSRYWGLLREDSRVIA